MINNGGALIVVRVPDWNGGHYFRAEKPDYELGDFEYEEWRGTPQEACETSHEFIAHREPLHEDAEDYVMSMQQILEVSVYWAKTRGRGETPDLATELGAK